MFNALVERKNLDRMVEWATMNSLRVFAVMVITIVAITGLCFCILLLNH